MFVQGQASGLLDYVQRGLFSHWPRGQGQALTGQSSINCADCLVVLFLFKQLGVSTLGQDDWSAAFGRFWQLSQRLMHGKQLWWLHLIQTVHARGAGQEVIKTLCPGFNISSLGHTQDIVSRYLGICREA